VVIASIRFDPTLGNEGQNDVDQAITYTPPSPVALIVVAGREGHGVTGNNTERVPAPVFFMRDPLNATELSSQVHHGPGVD